MDKANRSMKAYHMAQVKRLAMYDQCNTPEYKAHWQGWVDCVKAANEHRLISDGVGGTFPALYLVK